MKTFLLIAVLILCTVLRSFAQEPVPLEVWRVNKSNPFRGVYNRFCYLPNFRNGEGKNAIVIRKRSWDDKVDRMETWYNRDEADTLNQFLWPFGFCPYATPDMNGDGYRDFFNGSTLYLGTEKDEPDTNKPYTYPANSNGFAKLNDDNCDDLYYHGASPHLIHFRFGNTVAGKYQSVSIRSTYATTDTQSYEQLKAFYKNKQGKWRLLTHSKGWTKGMYANVWLPKKSYLRLYALDFVKIRDDSTAVNSQLIDEYQNPEWLEYVPNYNDKEPFFWLPINDAGLVYNSEHYPRILYYVSMNTMPDKEKKYSSYATIIDLTDDKIANLNTLVPNKSTDCKQLKHSITSNNHEEIYYVNGDGTIQFMKVNEEGIPIPSCYIDRNKPPLRWGTVSGLYSTNDITGDGIPDVACLLSSSSDGNTFAIIKGQTSISKVNEKQTIIAEPYPLPSTNVLVIPIIVNISAHYTLSLYSQTGNLIDRIFSDELSIGNHSLKYDTSTIVSGTYILRLTNGKNTTDRLIIINH